MVDAAFARMYPHPALRAEQPTGWPMKAPQPGRWSGYCMAPQKRTIDSQANFLLKYCPINAHRKRQSLRFSEHRSLLFSEHRSLLLACLEPRIKSREYAIR
ncbi:MAG: hypothetical protein WAU53_09250 [Rhodoplanes sp.]